METVEQRINKMYEELLEDNNTVNEYVHLENKFMIKNGETVSFSDN